MKLRWKILIGTAILLVLMAASLLVTMHVQPESEVEAYKKLLRDKGEKLELSEISPPPVAPEDNSVSAVEDAFRMLGSGSENVPYAMQMVAPGKALVGWRQPDARNSDFTNTWDDFAAGVEANRPAIELLHQVLERPKLDFQLDYKKGFATLLPQLAPMKRSAQLLYAAAIVDLHNGDSSAAATNILTMLALVNRDTSDDVLISHLVRIAIMNITLVSTWELTQATNVTDAQLAAVQKSWQQMDFLKDAQNAFVMERIISAMTIQKSRASHDGFMEVFGSAMPSGGSSGGGSTWPDVLENFTEGPRMGIAEKMWRSSWSYSAELQMLKSEQAIIESLRTMETNRSQFYKGDYDSMLTQLSSLGLTNAGEGFFSALRIPDFREYYRNPALARAINKTLQIETTKRVVNMAIALKRFQLKNGRLPEAAGDLAPEFMAAVPIDPYDGKPLQYHPNPDGTFLLYSVGEDGIDDGGDVTPAKPSSSGTPNWNWQRGRDWVWPQPATPAEVQDFYEHPPK